MEGFERYKEIIKRMAAEAMGFDLNHPRLFQGQVNTYGAPLDHLPVDLSSYAPLQNTSGVMYFMAGFSAVGSTHDPIAPLP
jgi:hypothetical protein